MSIAIEQILKYQCNKERKCCRDPMECQESLGLYLGWYTKCDGFCCGTDEEENTY